MAIPQVRWLRSASRANSPFSSPVCEDFLSTFDSGRATAASLGDRRYISVACICRMHAPLLRSTDERQIADGQSCSCVETAAVERRATTVTGSVFQPCEVACSSVHPSEDCTRATCRSFLSHRLLSLARASRTHARVDVSGRLRQTDFLNFPGWCTIWILAARSGVDCLQSSLKQPISVLRSVFSTRKHSNSPLRLL